MSTFPLTDAQLIATTKTFSPLSNEQYDALYAYYLSVGEMPYGVAKARTDDPYNWIDRQLIKRVSA